MYIYMPMYVYSGNKLCRNSYVLSIKIDAGWVLEDSINQKIILQYIYTSHCYKDTIKNSYTMIELNQTNDLQSQTQTCNLSLKKSNFINKWGWNSILFSIEIFDFYSHFPSVISTRSRNVPSNSWRSGCNFVVRYRYISSISETWVQMPTSQTYKIKLNYIILN